MSCELYDDLLDDYVDGARAAIALAGVGSVVGVHQGRGPVYSSAQC